MLGLLDHGLPARDLSARRPAAGKVRAHFVISGVGGLKIVRVLAHSGYGNHSGMSGRTYMYHIEAELGELRLSPANRAFNSASSERVMELLAIGDLLSGQRSGAARMAVVMIAIRSPQHLETRLGGRFN